MDFTVIWSNRAIADLEGAIEYLESAAPASISKFEREVVTTLERVRTNPYLGSKHEKITSGRVREVYCHPYRIIYRVSPSRSTVELITLWHSARDEPDLFH